MSIELLTRIVNASNLTKCVSLNNQQCMFQPTLINLHPNEYTEGLHYHPVAVNLDRCVGSCNTLNDLSNDICVPNKTGNLNLSIFNMIRGINKLKLLKKHISCACTYKFENSRKYKKDYIWNTAICSCENGKYLASIIDDSVITCDAIIEETVLTKTVPIKTVPTNFNGKR